MGTYDRIAGLRLHIDGYDLERLERAVSSDFTRVTTLISLHGADETGVGEDVTYSAENQTAAQAAGPVHALAGDWTVDDFSTHLDTLDLWPAGPEQPAFRDYRRWAYESAALDLALRQAERALYGVLGRDPSPVRFVVSMRLPEPPTLEPLRRWLDLYPDLRFKLDATSSWDDAFCAELAALGVVDSIDLKGAYRGTIVDQPADAALYRRVAEAFPEAWIEDPDLTDAAADAALEPYRDRITWDAPIHSVADIEGLAFRPRMVNLKPSRFGPLRRLFDAYDWVAENGIDAYGGGQFELGAGRGHIQYLASMFHSGTSNDVAPGGYNAVEPAPGLPRSPLNPAPAPVGFSWRL